MNFLQLNNISLSFGDRDILKNVTINISDISRIALAGANGSGKSTIMKLINGAIEYDSGSISKSKNLKIGYLPQSGIVYKGNTLLEEAEKAFDEQKKLTIKLEEIAIKLENNDISDTEQSELLHEHHDIQEELQNSGYWNREEKIGSILLGLGFSEYDFNNSVTTFSGGWQMRIALAKILLKSPNILLLDEPTNYLDLEAREWLRSFLDNYDGGLMIVSHDRYFLDSIAKETAELFLGELKLYKGSYTQYQKQRKSELENLQKNFVKQQEEIAHLEEFINRFRYQATKAKQVQSRVKMLEKMDKIVIPSNMKKMNLRFSDPPHCGKQVLQIENLNKSYDAKQVIKNLDITVTKGKKVVVSGVNGAGKSTLLRIISGEDKDYSGNIKLGTDVKVGYFAQDQEQHLDPNKTVLEEAEASATNSDLPKVRKMLGSFLFSDDDVFKKVSVLSGGEKNRLALMKMLLQPFNLLIMDEPTNHLDIDSKQILLEALKNYSATLLFVSHDRYFIEHLAEEVLELTPSGHQLYLGDYNYYLWKKENSNTENSEVIEEKVVISDSKHQRELDKKKKAEIRRASKNEENKLHEIENLEAEYENLNSMLEKPEVYSDVDKSKEISDRIKSITNKIEKATLEWEELHEIHHTILSN